MSRQFLERLVSRDRDYTVQTSAVLIGGMLNGRVFPLDEGALQYLRNSEAVRSRQGFVRGFPVYLSPNNQVESHPSAGMAVTTERYRLECIEIPRDNLYDFEPCLPSNGRLAVFIEVSISMLNAFGHILAVFSEEVIHRSSTPSRRGRRHNLWAEGFPPYNAEVNRVTGNNTMTGNVSVSVQRTRDAAMMQQTQQAELVESERRRQLEQTRQQMERHLEQMLSPQAANFWDSHLSRARFAHVGLDWAMPSDESAEATQVITEDWWGGGHTVMEGTDVSPDTSVEKKNADESIADITKEPPRKRVRF